VQHLYLSRDLCCWVLKNTNFKFLASKYLGSNLVRVFWTVHVKTLLSYLTDGWLFYRVALSCVIVGTGEVFLQSRYIAFYSFGVKKKPIEAPQKLWDKIETIRVCCTLAYEIIIHQYLPVYHIIIHFAETKNNVDICLMVSLTIKQLIDIIMGMSLCLLCFTLRILQITLKFWITLKFYKTRKEF
jgi:hypothetical protein